MAERLRAALAHGIEDNTLDVEMTVRAAVGEGSERLWVPLQVSVPIRNLGREPAERGFNCRLRVYLAVMDDEGRMSDVLEVPVSFSIGEEEVEAALAAHWRMSRQLKMRRGRQRLAVAIRDEVTQVAALTTRGLDLSDRGSQVDG